jgi:chromosomal replication initiation ATPase DnaA
MTELVPDTVRQASHIFRGYNYQAYQTILAWLKCGENEEILTEFVEDVDLVRRDAQGNITDAELTQIKNESKRVTLNSKPARDLIKNFFRHKKRNPDTILFMRLCTVSDRGKERNHDWLYAGNGLDFWDLIKSRKLSAADQETAIGILKSFYQKKTSLSKDALNFIRDSDRAVFLSDFVDRISWDTGQSSYADIEKDIKWILAELPRSITDPLEVKQVIYSLWYFVTHSIAGTSRKTINKADLETILSEETTARIDRESLKIMAADNTKIAAGVENLEKMVSVLFEQATKQPQDAAQVQVVQPQTYQSNLPPLPTPCADRSQEIAKIQDALNSAGFLWIHGSTGYGKTTLANLYARHTSSTGMWFRLRNYSDFTLIAALQKIYMIIGAKLKDRDIVVLDDLSNIEQQTFTIELLLMIFDYVKKSSAKIMITSQYRLPSRLKAQISDGLFEYVAPEMSEADIKLLLNRFSLDDDQLIRFWSTYILASTSGHPQLVGAFAAYAKETGWVFTAEMLRQQPRSVNEVKAESRRLLAETIKNDEARELARYLSLITGPFNREFALNIGNAAPGLKEPGRALDTLVGPWIESLGNDTYSLSPLLRGYAEADAGKDGIEKYYVVICVAWLKKRTLTPFELVQAMIAALTAKMDPLIAKLCEIQFTTSPEDFKIISKELFFIPHLYIESQAQLTGIQPMTRFMFRYFQLKITENNEDWKSYLRIYLQIQKEIHELDASSLEYKMCMWMFYIDTIIRTNTPVPPKARVLQALTIIEMAHNKELAEITSFLDSDKLELDSLLMIAVHNIDSYLDLKFLLTELKKRSADMVTSFFRGFEIYPDNLSLLIDRVWLNESKKDDPKWDECIKVFVEAMEFARQHNNEWLLAGAARGIIVIYDEYLDDTTKALQAVDKARSLLENSHPLIDLQEATVRYRSDQYEKVIEIITNLESFLTPELMPIHRVHALRRAIRSADGLKQWDKVSYFAERGLQISPYIIVEGMGELGSLCFEAELGWCSHEKGDLDDSVKKFESVLTKMEQFPDQEYPLFCIFRLRFGSALGWLSHTWKMNGTVIQLKTSISKPFAGMFANFENPPEETKDHTVQAYPLLWAHIAKYSASFAHMDFIDSIAKRALNRTDGKQFFLALTETHHAIHLNSLVNMEFDRAIEGGIEYAKLFAILPDFKATMGERWNLNEPLDIDGYLQNADPGFYDKWSDCLSAFILEPMTMFICSLDEQPKFDFSRWIDHFIDTFGEGHRSVKFVKWMEKVTSAVFEGSDAIEAIRRDAWDTSGESEQTRRLSILAMCVAPDIQLSENLSAQFSMLKNMMLPAIANSHWALFYYRMVVKRWSYLAINQKFLMISPGIWSDKILEAISASFPAPPDVARLLLLVGEAIAITWPNEMLSELREISQ